MDKQLCELNCFYGKVPHTLKFLEKFQQFLWMGFDVWIWIYVKFNFFHFIFLKITHKSIVWVVFPTRVRVVLKCFYTREVVVLQTNIKVDTCTLASIRETNDRTEKASLTERCLPAIRHRSFVALAHWSYECYDTTTAFQLILPWLTQDWSDFSYLFFYQLRLSERHVSSSNFQFYYR